MRYRLLRRRLTISAPRVTVRSALPWPLRWAAVAIVLGLCAAMTLWAFDLGKRIAGLDAGSREELQRLRAEVSQLREHNRLQHEKQEAAGSLRIAEQAAMDRLLEQLRQLEADNRSLREDLGFFEKLTPTGKPGNLTIRGLHAETLEGGGQLRWQVLAMQPMRNAPEFKGRLELLLAGTLNGAAWSSTSPAVIQPLQFRQYRRVQGVAALPPGAMVKTVTARLMDGTSLRAAQTFSLEL